MKKFLSLCVVVFALSSCASHKGCACSSSGESSPSKCTSCGEAKSSCKCGK